MTKYIQKVEGCSFLISRSVKCVTRTTKVDNSVLPEPEIFSFITRFFLCGNYVSDFATFFEFNSIFPWEKELTVP